ncbi:MAG: hypothetical protein AAGD15_14120 [Agrobacterium cavarae]
MNKRMDGSVEQLKSGAGPYAAGCHNRIEELQAQRVLKEGAGSASAGICKEPLWISLPETG